MKYRVYSPWDSIVVEAKDEATARAEALQTIIWEAQDANPDHLDAEPLFNDGVDDVDSS